MTDSHKHHLLDIDEQSAPKESFGDSAKLVISGLRELNQEGAANDYFHLPILLVSTGIERFLKATIGQNELGLVFKSGSGGGNQLRPLLRQITTNYYSDEFLRQNPAVADEIRILKHDDRILKLVDTFADFSMGARYYNLNILEGMEPPGACQEDELEKLRMEIMEESDSKNVDKEICYRITVSCELFMRALCRLAAMETNSGSSNRISGAVRHFLSLADEQLGTTDYSRLDF